MPSNVEIKIMIALMACSVAVFITTVVGFWKGFDTQLGVGISVCAVGFIGLRSMAKRSGWW